MYIFIYTSLVGIDSPDSLCRSNVRSLIAPWKGSVFDLES